MSTITFLSTEIDTKEIKCKSNEKMKDVCKRYAKEINKNYKQLVFFSEGEKLNKKLNVNEFINLNPEKEIFVVLMDKNINSDSDEEKANSKKIKKEIIESIKNPDKKITYEKTQELIVQYGFDLQKRIEKEKEEHPENFIKIEEAIKKKDTNKKLYVLGQLGKSLENMGIEVAIDKTEGKNDDDSLIINQIISSGMVKGRKYEIHYEDDVDIKKKYEIINNENGEQEKFIEKMKNFLSESIKVPKNEIFIGNIRKGCIAYDAVLKGKYDRDKIKELAKNKKIKSIYEKNILGVCKLTPDMLDEKGNRDPKDWPKSTETRGGMPYYPPTNNWVGYGLKVLGQYDNGNDNWIAMDGNKNEWAVAYHGTSTSAVKPICKKDGKFYSTVEEGAKQQKCSEMEDVNERSENYGKKCGEGAYASPHLEYASQYFKGAMIMCRVNPNKIRIPKGPYEKNELITDGTRNTIRPYRLLVNINKKSQNSYRLCEEGAYCSPHFEYAICYFKGVIIMCRVNPNKLRIPSGDYGKTEWITEGTRNSVRPYRILFNFNDD